MTIQGHAIRVVKENVHTNSEKDFNFDCKEAIHGAVLVYLLPIYSTHSPEVNGNKENAEHYSGKKGLHFTNAAVIFSVSDSTGWKRN